MSELSDLVKKINEAKNRNLTDADITALANKLEVLKKTGGVNAVQLATTTAIKESRTFLRRLIPNSATIKTALFNSNPLLLGVTDMIRRSSEAIQAQERSMVKSNESQIKQIEAGLKELMKSNDESIEQKKNVETPLLKSSLAEDKKLTEIALSINNFVEEIVEQLKYSNNLDENIIGENRINKLKGSGVDTDVVAAIPKEADKSQKLLEGILATQKLELQHQILNSLTGFGRFTSIFTSLFTGGGLLAAGGAFLTKFQSFLKVGVKILGPIGAIASGLFSAYDSFVNAEEYLNKTVVDLPTKLQYAITRLLTSILEPFDYIGELVTGKDLKIRESVDSFLLEMENTIGEFVGGLAFDAVQASKMLVDGIDFSGSNFSEIFSKLNSNANKVLDTYLSGYVDRIDKFLNVGQLRDEIEKSYESIKQTLLGDFSPMDLINTLGNNVANTTSEYFNSFKKSVGETIQSVFGGKPEFNFDFLDGAVDVLGDLINQLKNSFKGAYNMFIEDIAKGADLISTSAGESIRSYKLSMGNEGVKSRPIAPVERGSRTEPLPTMQSIEDQIKKQKETEALIETFKEGMKELGEKMQQSKGGDTTITTAAPITNNQSTTIVKGRMTTSPSIRPLFS